MTNDNSRPPLRLLLVSLLSFAGLLLATYLTHHYYEVRSGNAIESSACDVSSTVSCTAVAETKYAQLAQGVPLSSIAAGWFAAMLLISLIARRESWRVEGQRGLALMALAGAAASVFYLCIMAFVIHKWCLHCLGIDAVNFTLLGLLLSLKPAGLKNAPLKANPWMFGIGLTLVVMAATYITLKSFNPASASSIPPPAVTPSPSAPSSTATPVSGAATPSAPDSTPFAPGSAPSAPAPVSGALPADSAAASAPVSSPASTPVSAPASGPMSSPAGAVPADIAAMDPRLQEMVAAFFASPKLPLRLGPDLASSGPADAPVTMVEFSDYQCSHCKHAAENLPRILSRYSGKIRLINRHYPLSSECNRALQQPAHPAACEAARLAYCAVAAGKFPTVHDSFFRHQDDLQPERLTPFLEEVGADSGALYKCSDTPLAAAALQRDVEEGIRLGVESTPTFFINGRKLAGFYPEPFWHAVLSRVVAGDERVPPFNPPPPGTSLLKK
jgi:protein-disulfide isomerase/uncharacterized membrane protein